MRILYLTNGFPYPLTSGYLRHYFLIKELSHHHAVSLLSIADRPVRPEDIAALEPFSECVMTFSSSRRRRSLPHKLLGRLRSLAQPGSGVEEMRAAVEQLVGRKRFDVVISGKRTLPAVAPLRNLPLIADMCDASSMRIKRSIRYANPARAPLLALEYVKMRRAEQALMEHASHSMFISCRDREALLGDTKHGTTIVPNGVDLEFWRRSAPTLGSNTIVFTGAMNYRPNSDAALYLIDQVLPLVQRVVPEAQLMIVGRDPTPQLMSAGQRAGVTVTGYVDDVRPYLEKATVFAAPLRFGAGVQNKVLEAMAMEVPVVASSLAADGLRTEEGRQPPVQTAEGAEEFAAQIVEKFNRRNHDPSPDSAARRFVAENYTWSYSGTRLQEVIRDVTGKRKEP